MNLQYPLKGIGTTPGIFLSQFFGGNAENYAIFNMKGHNGADWACPMKTSVYAVHDGIISFDTEITDYGKGYGKDLWLHFTEDGVVYECIYGHLDSYEGVPRQVKAGELIAYSDNTGYSTGPHLHFGIRKLLNGNVVDYNNGYYGYIDPLPFFGKEIMEILQVVGESTLVVKNLDGKYYQIATAPELYPFVAKTLGLEGKTFGTISRAEVDANLGGDLTAGLSFISK